MLNHLGINGFGLVDYQHQEEPVIQYHATKVLRKDNYANNLIQYLGKVETEIITRIPINSDVPLYIRYNFFNLEIVSNHNLRIITFVISLDDDNKPLFC